MAAVVAVAAVAASLRVLLLLLVPQANLSFQVVAPPRRAPGLVASWSGRREPRTTPGGTTLLRVDAPAGAAVVRRSSSSDYVGGCSTSTSSTVGDSGSAIGRSNSAVVTRIEPTGTHDDGIHDKGSRERRFMYMTAEQDAELKEKGDREWELLRIGLRPLEAIKTKATGGGGGFGGGIGGKGVSNNNSKKKRNRRKNGSGGKPASPDDGGNPFAAKVAACAAALRRDGIVRIDNALDPDLASSLRDYLVDLRRRAVNDVEAGRIVDSQERFADVLLNRNRCDLKVPLGPEPVHAALLHVLTKTVVKPLLEHVFDSYDPVADAGSQALQSTGDQAVLYELNCFMSNTGARRQLVHADNACHEAVPGVLREDEPVMLTCFIALQDIDETMGPTTWIPGTHNRAAHDLFYDTASEGGGKEELLRTREAAQGTLPAGSCAVFDPRTLHCGGENWCPDPDRTRAQFYFSFVNPRVDHPGCPTTSGYGIAAAGLTLRDLTDQLLRQASAGGDLAAAPRLSALARFP